MRLLTGFTFCLLLHIISVNCQTFSQCNGKPNGVYISGQNGCQSYIYCDGDRSYESTCPLGLAFNTVDGTCDDASKVQCNDGIGSPSRPTPSSPYIPKIICPPIAKGGDPIFLPSPDTCSEYFMCIHGDTISLKCSNNLHFNSDTQRCESPESANCKIPGTTASSLSTLAPTVRPPTPIGTSSPTGTTRLSTTPVIPSTHTQTTVPVTGTTRLPTTPVIPSTQTKTTVPVTGTTRLPTTPVIPSTQTQTPGSTTWTTRPTTTPVTPTSRLPSTPPTPIQTTVPVTGTTRLTTRPVTPTAPVTGTTWLTTTPVTPPQTTIPVTGTTRLSTTPAISTLTPTWSPSWSSTALPTVDPAFLCDLQPTGYFAYPDDCRFYYRCLNGFASKQECPKGYGWDVNKKMCTTSGCST